MERARVSLRSARVVLGAVILTAGLVLGGQVAEGEIYDPSDGVNAASNSGPSTPEWQQLHGFYSDPYVGGAPSGLTTLSTNNTQSVPEPASLLLLGLGLGVLAWRRHRGR